MCGRFTLRRNELESAKRELRGNATGPTYLWEPRYNIAPTDQVPILTRDQRGQRSLSLMIWGIPRTRNCRTIRQINARAGSIRSSFARCAVVSDGFYEWAGELGPIRQPYFFHRPDDGLILMAGFWDFHPVERGYLQAFVIITTAANEMVAPIHNRMPAILDPGDALAMWLNPQSVPDDLREVLAPAPEDLLRMRAVAPLVNSVKNEGPELINPPRQEPFRLS